MINVATEAGRLSSEEVRYWKKFFLGNLKVGVEIEFDCIGDRSRFRDQFIAKLGNGSEGFNFGKYGIKNLASDGSVPRGWELKTVGRRLDFLNLYIQYKLYYDVFDGKATVSPNCGLHNHILIDYVDNSTSLEQDVPGIIFRNFCQLMRSFAPEFVWLTSTVKGDDYITRYEQYCMAEQLYSHTPVNKDAKNYAQILNNGGRYRFINTKYFRSTNDSISRFHLELRFPDGSIYPAQIASQNILWGAVLLKAIEVSEFGVIDTGTPSEWATTKELYGRIRNNVRAGSRLSSCPNQENLDLIQQRGRDTLKFLKPSIAMYDVRAYRVLTFLNEEPVSIARRTKPDNQIVSEYHDLLKTMYVLDTEPYHDMIKAISLQEIKGAVSAKQWTYQIAQKSGKAFQEIETDLTKLDLIKPLVWDSELGTYVFK